MVKSLMGIIGLTLVLGMALPAHAENPVDCTSEFDDVQGAIGSALFKNDHDQDRMLYKVFQVVSKFNLEKNGGAESKLVDIGDKTVVMRDAGKPKIKDDLATTETDEVQEILDTVSDALFCVPGGLDPLAEL